MSHLQPYSRTHLEISGLQKGTVSLRLVQSSGEKAYIITLSVEATDDSDRDRAFLQPTNMASLRRRRTVWRKY